MLLETTPKKVSFNYTQHVFFIADFGSEIAAVHGCYVLLPQLLRKMNLNSSKNKDKDVSTLLSLQLIRAVK